ncbi:hypothetical protein ACTXT7_000019 [Hymenolepis weldensis]
MTILRFLAHEVTFHLKVHLHSHLKRVPAQVTHINCLRVSTGTHGPLIAFAQFRAYKITRKQVKFTCLVNDLTPEAAKLVCDVLGKPSTTPYDGLKFAILECIEEPKLEFSKRLRKELMTGVIKGVQSQKRYNSEPDPPLMDSEMEFDAEHFHTSNRERSRELPSIAGNSNSVQGEKQYCPPD